MSGPTGPEIVQAITEVILDKACLDAQDEIHFFAWRVGHAINDCDVTDTILKAAFGRLLARGVGLPEKDVDEFLDRIYTDGPNIEISAVLVIRVGGRQFLVSGSSINGQDVNIVHEVEKPFDFVNAQ